MKVLAFARVLLIFFCLWASAGQDSAFDVETDGFTAVQKTTSGCMYAVNFGDSFHVTSLFNVNPATGMLSAGTNIGIGNVIGLEMHTDGFLYTVRASGSLAPGTEKALYKVNPDTGVATLIGSLGLTGALYEGDIAFHPISGVLYGISGSKFFTINLGTGAATLLGSVGVFNSDFSSLAFDTSGNLWAIDNTTTPGTYPTKLLRLDPANGATLSSVNTSLNLGSMGGMDYDEASGDLYVMDSQYSGSVYAGTNSVYTINT